MLRPFFEPFTNTGHSVPYHIRLPSTVLPPDMDVAPSAATLNQRSLPPSRKELNYSQ